MKKTGMLLGVRANAYKITNERGETLEGVSYSLSFALDQLIKKDDVQGYDIMTISAKGDCFDMEDEPSAKAIWQKYGNRWCQVIYSYNEKFKRNKCEMILLDDDYQPADLT